MDRITRNFSCGHNYIQDIAGAVARHIDIKDVPGRSSRVVNLTNVHRASGCMSNRYGILRSRSSESCFQHSHRNRVGKVEIEEYAG